MTDERMAHLYALALKHAESVPNADSVDVFNAIISALVDNEKGVSADLEGKRLVVFHCLVDPLLSDEDAAQSALVDLFERAMPDKRKMKIRLQTANQPRG